MKKVLHIGCNCNLQKRTEFAAAGDHDEQGEGLGPVAIYFPIASGRPILSSQPSRQNRNLQELRQNQNLPVHAYHFKWPITDQSTERNGAHQVCNPSGLPV